MLTSKGTMDKENPAVRRYLAQRADLIGAIRLPEDTFRGMQGQRRWRTSCSFFVAGHHDHAGAGLGTPRYGRKRDPDEPVFHRPPRHGSRTDGNRIGTVRSARPASRMRINRRPTCFDEAIPNLHAELTERADEPEALRMTHSRQTRRCATIPLRWWTERCITVRTASDAGADELHDRREPWSTGCSACGTSPAPPD